MTMNSGANDGKMVQSLLKGFNIIKLLDEEGTTSASKVASELDIPVSTVYLYLKTLVETGYVLKDSEGYKLSLRFLETGSRVRQRRGVFQAARNELLELSRLTGERVGIGVEEQGHRVQLWQMDQGEAFDDNIVGEHTHLHWTSLGKALLASYDDEEVKQIVERQGLPEATENTVTDLDTLLEELSRIRVQGFAIEDEERKPGMRSVSVPLVDAEGKTKAAIGIAAAKSHMDVKTCAQYVGLLQEKSNVISIRYNY